MYSTIHTYRHTNYQLIFIIYLREEEKNLILSDGFIL